MRKILKKCLIPHPGNDHKPHLLREKGIIALVLVAGLIFAGAVGLNSHIRGGGLAAIFENALVDLTNHNRVENNSKPLAENSLLMQAAKLKAEDMAKKGYFSHISPDGLGPQDWLKKVGYNFQFAGENLAVHFSDSKAVEDAWMESAGHRANIINPAFTEIGTATATGYYEGVETQFVVMYFGKQLPAAAKNNVAAKPKTNTVISVKTDKPAPIAQVKDNFVESTQEEVNTPEVVQVNPESNSLTESFQNLATRPGAAIMYSYSFMGIVVLGVLLLMVSNGIRKDQVKNIAYGVAVIAFMITLGSLYFILFTQTGIIA